MLRAETVEAALRELAAWGSVDVLLTGELGGRCVGLLEAVHDQFPDTVRIVHLHPDSASIGPASTSAHVTVTTDAPTEKLVDTLDHAVAGRRGSPRRPASGVRQAPLPSDPKRTTG
jgi:hypothetical protein